MLDGCQRCAKSSPREVLTCNKTLGVAGPRGSLFALSEEIPFQSSASEPLSVRPYEAWSLLSLCRSPRWPAPTFVSHTEPVPAAVVWLHPMPWEIRTDSPLVKTDKWMWSPSLPSSSWLQQRSAAQQPTAMANLCSPKHCSEPWKPDSTQPTCCLAGPCTKSFYSTQKPMKYLLWRGEVIALSLFSFLPMLKFFQLEIFRDCVLPTLPLHIEEVPYYGVYYLIDG